jgi:uncharacterized protein YdeI (YjbR/CyaY-like superfamily)
MGKKIKQIDAYISGSADFAKPILHHLRELVHKTCPETEEKIKWGMPFFDYHNGPLCNMAAFKQHCTFGFWKAKLMKDQVLMDNAKADTAMGHLGRITSLKDLPPEKKLAAWIREAMQLNDEGIKLPKPKPVTKPVEVPPYFLNAIKKNKKAFATFEKFAPGHIKEYVVWITEAKREETRDKRIQQAIEWMAEGKDRNWKYK